MGTVMTPFRSTISVSSGVCYGTGCGRYAVEQSRDLLHLDPHLSGRREPEKMFWVLGKENEGQGESQKRMPFLA